MEKKEKKVQINLNPAHTPVLYTDTIFMNVNDDGVTLDMGQKVGKGEQLTIVTRVGMSREHAKKFVKKLSELLALSEKSPKNASTN